jgi:hypothetical protein
MIIRTSIDIEAPANKIWELLGDFGTYGAWNPLTPRIDGDLIEGSVVTLHVRLGGQKMVRKHIISRVEKARAICWTIRSRWPWLLRGERCQTLEELGDGRCRYANEERVHGLASWLVALFFRGKIRGSIAAVGEALKAQVENC